MLSFTIISEVSATEENETFDNQVTLNEQTSDVLKDSAEYEITASNVTKYYGSADSVNVSVLDSNGTACKNINVTFNIDNQNYTTNNR